MRQVRFPLADGLVGEPAAITARAHLKKGLGPLVEAVSPVFESMPGYPSPSDPERLSALADLADELMAFDVDVREAYLAPEADRRALALKVLARHGHKRAVREADALLLLRMLRDLVGWGAVLEFIGTLPKYLAHQAQVMELEYLAIAKTGTPGAAIKAVARLETLIATYGETSERLGLLGGRYKQLASEASDEAERRRYLDRAISSYERGMMADLNDYYPTSNLPRLYGPLRHRSSPWPHAAGRWRGRPQMSGYARRCSDWLLIAGTSPRRSGCFPRWPRKDRRHGRSRLPWPTCRGPLTTTPTRRSAGN
jgi:hypothetical protein